MRVCKCPQPPLLAHASGGSPPHLLSAQGTQIDLWRLGVAHDRQQHVRRLVPPVTDVLDADMVLNLILFSVARISSLWTAHFLASFP